MRHRILFLALATVGALLTLGSCALPTASSSNTPASTNGNSGTAVWAKSVVSGAAQTVWNATTVDSSGNLYAAGQIRGSGTYDLGNGVTAAGPTTGYSVILVKYSPSGVAQWARVQASGTTGGNGEFKALTVDSSHNLYAAGVIWDGTYDFGNGVTVTGVATNTNHVLVKYDSTGTAQWARTLVATPSVTNAGSSFFGVTTDGSGDVYASGWIQGQKAYDFGGVTATGYNSSFNAVLVKYSASGTAQWASTVSGSGESAFYAVAKDSSGRIYTAGYAYVSNGVPLDFGNSVTTPGVNYVYCPILVQYNSSGAAQSVQTLTQGDGDFYWNAIAIDGSDNVFVAGEVYINSTNDFGNGVVAAGSSSTGANAILAKYNASGTPQWARTTSTGSADSLLNGLATDTLGNVYAAGYVTGSEIYTFGTGVSVTPPYAGGKNLVVVKYSGSGTAQWARSVASSAQESTFQGLAMGPSNSLYAAGTITGAGTFGFGSGVTASGPATGTKSNLLLVKYQ